MDNLNSQYYQNSRRHGQGLGSVGSSSSQQRNSGGIKPYSNQKGPV